MRNLHDEQNLLSKDTINTTIEVYSREILRSTSIIYLSVSILLVGVVICMPFIYITISVKSYSLIRPASEITPIQSLVSGKVRQSFVTKNKAVK